MRGRRLYQFLQQLLCERLVRSSILGHSSTSPRVASFYGICILLLLPFLVGSKNSGELSQQGSTTGVATGPPHASVKDAQQRPITAGGFVDNAPLVFIDTSKKAGLDKFHHHSGT